MTRAFILSLILSALALPVSAFSAECELPSPWQQRPRGGPTPSLKEIDSLILVSEGDYDPALFHSLTQPANKALKEYRDWVRSQVNVEPKSLMKAAGEFFDKKNYAHLTWPVYQQEMGQVRPITCLEALLTSEHLKVRPYKQVNSEYFAYMLLKDGRYRLYFVSQDQSSMYAPPYSVLSEITYLIDYEGWQEAFHLHFHPFSFDTVTEDQPVTGAIPAPSIMDIRAYKHWWNHPTTPNQPDDFLITNGFHTLHMRAEEVLSIEP